MPVRHRQTHNDLSRFCGHGVGDSQLAISISSIAASERGDDVVRWLGNCWRCARKLAAPLGVHTSEAGTCANDDDRASWSIS
jgi:hypothetical protein